METTHKFEMKIRTMIDVTVIVDVSTILHNLTYQTEP